jgi:hypothetical protein
LKDYEPKLDGRRMGEFVMSKVADRIAEDLDRRVNEVELGNPHLSSHNYEPAPLNPVNFHPFKCLDCTRRIAFVDGGNQPLLQAPNFSVQFNRIYFNVFHDNRRSNDEQTIPQRLEFVSATCAQFRGDELYFDTRLFPIIEANEDFLPDPADLSFSSFDRRIMQGTSRADIQRVATIARRFAEWRFATAVVENILGDGDILVMDGTLRTAFKNENRYAREGYAAARKNGVLYTGLSKTSNLFTTTGLSLLGALRKLAEDNGIDPPWYYHPVARSKSPEHEAAIFIVRLRPESRRVFRYEIQAQQAEQLSERELDEVFSELSHNSCDIAFPGYPYGLVDADANAKVVGSDVEMHRVMLLSKLSSIGSWPKFSRHMESSDAHDVLDKLKEW